MVRQQTLEGPEAPVVGLIGEQVPVTERHPLCQLAPVFSAIHGEGMLV